MLNQKQSTEHRFSPGLVELVGVEPEVAIVGVEPELGIRLEGVVVCVGLVTGMKKTRGALTGKEVKYTYVQEYCHKNTRFLNTGINSCNILDEP